MQGLSLATEQQKVSDSIYRLDIMIRGLAKVADKKVTYII
jgi:hypothetical protein